MAIKRSELANAKWGNVTSGRRLAPVHSGEVLLKDFIEQAQYDLDVAERESGAAIHDNVMPLERAA